MNEGEMTPVTAGNNKMNQKFLICDITQKKAASFSDMEWAGSPIQCMDRALEWKPDVIVISFINISIKERKALIELSSSLKRNAYTKNCIVLAVLPSKHRRLVEELIHTGVDYIVYFSETGLDHDLIHELIRSIKVKDSPDLKLETLCPFLNYRKIDSQHEMIICGAWRNRMVLGGKWLHELCETDNHLHCEYFLNPVTES